MPDILPVTALELRSRMFSLLHTWHRNMGGQ